MKPLIYHNAKCGSSRNDIGSPASSVTTFTKENGTVVAWPEAEK